MRYVTYVTLRFLLVVCALGLCLMAPVAADFDSGLSAFLNSDYRRAREIWQPLAEDGDAQSQFDVGLMLEGGHGIPPDAEKAAAWYRRAAEQGITEAELSLGRLNEHGRGVARNMVQAAALYRSAAIKGIAQAQYNLAKLYLGGEGVTPNRDLGIAWMQRSAAQSYGRAAQHLDMMGIALEEPESAIPEGELAASERTAGETLPGEPATESATGIAAAPAIADSGEHLNILDENNQFELPLAAVDAAADNPDQPQEIVVREGDFAVLLATFDREAAANKVWREMTMRYPKLLQGLRPKFTALTLGDDRAVLWRLEAGMLENEPAAVELCKALKRAGEYCYPVRAGAAADE